MNIDNDSDQKWQKKPWKWLKKPLSFIKSIFSDEDAPLKKGSPGMRQRIRSTITIKKIVISGLLLLVLYYPTHIGIRWILSNINLSVIKILGVVIIVMFFLIIDLIAVRSANKEGETKKIVQNWMVVRNKIYFLFLWIIFIVLLSTILKYINVKAWWSLYLYKEEGNWLFYVIHLLLIVGVWIATTNFGKDGVDEKSTKSGSKAGDRIKMVGKAFVWMAILTWITMYFQNRNSLTVIAAMESNQAVPVQEINTRPSPNLPPETLSYVKVWVKVGGQTIGPIAFRDVGPIEDIPGRMFRFNRHGDFVLWETGEWDWSKHTDLTFDKVRTMEFRASTVDYYVKILIPN